MENQAKKIIKDYESNLSKTIKELVCDAYEADTQTQIDIRCESVARDIISKIENVEHFNLIFNLSSPE